MFAAIVHAVAHGVGVTVGVFVGVDVGPVGVFVGVLVGGAPQQTKTELLIVTLSIRTPVAETLLSLPIRHFSWMFCPLAAAGRFAFEVM